MAATPNKKTNLNTKCSSLKPPVLNVVRDKQLIQQQDLLGLHFLKSGPTSFTISSKRKKPAENPELRMSALFHVKSRINDLV